MERALPILYLVRHGQTAWSESGKHTGRTDIPLNEQGEASARLLGEHLREFEFTRVFTSPLQRASKTCELAGFSSVAETDSDLVEWDYGKFEGLLTRDIRRDWPGWELFRDGCPNGESPQNVSERADRFLAKVKVESGRILAFSSGHMIRMIAARWLNMSSDAGRAFYCHPVSVSVLGYEHGRQEEPTILLWNWSSELRS